LDIHWIFVFFVNYAYLESKFFPSGGNMYLKIAASMALVCCILSITGCSDSGTTSISLSVSNLQSNAYIAGNALTITGMATPGDPITVSATPSQGGVTPSAQVTTAAQSGTWQVTFSNLTTASGVTYDLTIIDSKTNSAIVIKSVTMTEGPFFPTNPISKVDLILDDNGNPEVNFKVAGTLNEPVDISLTPGDINYSYWNVVDNNPVDSEGNINSSYGQLLLVNSYFNPDWDNATTLDRQFDTHKLLSAGNYLLILNLCDSNINCTYQRFPFTVPNF
jgi:hypothetical protein